MLQLGALLGIQQNSHDSREFEASSHFDLRRQLSRHSKIPGRFLHLARAPAQEVIVWVGVTAAAARQHHTTTTPPPRADARRQCALGPPVRSSTAIAMEGWASALARSASGALGLDQAAGGAAPSEGGVNVGDGDSPTAAAVRTADDKGERYSRTSSGSGAGLFGFALPSFASSLLSLPVRRVR